MLDILVRNIDKEGFCVFQTISRLPILSIYNALSKTKLGMPVGEMLD